MLVCMDDYNSLILNMKAKILGTQPYNGHNFQEGVPRHVSCWCLRFFSSYHTHPYFVAFFTSRMYVWLGGVQLGRMFRAPNLKFGGPKFKSSSVDNQLDLLEVDHKDQLLICLPTSWDSFLFSSFAVFPTHKVNYWVYQ